MSCTSNRFRLPIAILAAVLLALTPAVEAQAQAWKVILRIAAEQIAQAGISAAINKIGDYVVAWGGPGTPEGNFREALDYFRGTNGHRLDETEAVKYATWSANAGYSRAQEFLGDLSLRNLQYSEARKWYLDAAKNEADAQFQLGNLAYLGRLGSPDYETALYWYRRAAARHHSTAEFQVASILMLGQAHSPSEAEKVESADDLEDAGNQGLAAAQECLGYQYANGIGRPQNYCEAVQWSKKAADRGRTLAASNLGIAYENGQCNGYVDRILALHYYRQAANQGDAPSSASAIRVQNTIKAELASLAAIPDAPRPELCTLRYGASLYDVDGNEVRLLAVPRNITIAARQNNNEFARTAPIFGAGLTTTWTFARVADLGNCQSALLPQ